MNAPSQIVQVPLRVGMNQSVDVVSAPPGMLTRVRNAVWNKIGRIEKRDGTIDVNVAPFDGSASPSNIRRLFARNDELCAVDRTSVYSIDGARNVGRIAELEATWDAVVDSAAGIGEADVDANANYTAFSWTSGGNVFVSVRGTNGSAYLPPLLVAAGSHPRVFVSLSGLVSVFCADGGGNVVAKAISPAGVIATTTVATGIDFFDVCWTGGGLQTSWVLFAATTGGVALNVRRVTYAPTVFTSGAPVALGTGAAVGGQRAMCVVSAAECVYLTWNNATDQKIRVSVHDPATLALTAGPTVVRTYANTDFGIVVQAARYDASHCVVAWTEGNGSTYHTRSLEVTSGAAAVANTDRTSFFSCLASRLFALDGRVYAQLTSIRPAVLIGSAAVRQNAAFLVEVEVATDGGAANAPMRLAAILTPSIGMPMNVGTICAGVPVVGSAAFSLFAIATEAATIYSSGTAGELRLAKLTYDFADPHRPVRVGAAVALAGAYLASYGGSWPFEVGFMLPPRVISATPGGGGNMAAGDYLYSFVYEWRGPDGLLHRSAPSQPQKVTVGATGNVAFVLECTGVHGRANLTTGFGASNPFPVHIVPFRTTVGGSSLYRMSFDATATNVVVNDPRSASVAWNDTVSDASFDGLGGSLSTRPLLYTTGGFLDELAPPGSTTQVQHRGRIWLVDGDRRTIRFSKKLSDDSTVFPGFNETLKLLIPERVVALASLDDKLVIFTERGIYILYGDGPAANGQNSDFAEPTLVHGDMPCISARSVVSYEDGIAFQSVGGLYLLSRQLEVSWLGRAVQDEIAFGVQVLSATHVQRKAQIRFSIGTQVLDGVSRAVVLVYDYNNDLWSKFDFPGVQIESEIATAAGVFSTNGTGIETETSSVNTDTNSFTWATYEFELTLFPSGPIAWQHLRRVQLLGAFQTNHKLRVRFAFNGSSAYAQDYTFTEAMVAQHKDCPTLRIGSQNGANPKAKSLTIRVTDVSPTDLGYPAGVGKGGWFQAIGLEFVPKPGLPRSGARLSKV